MNNDIKKIMRIKDIKEDIKFEQITLERLKFGIQKRISKYLLKKDQQANFEMLVRNMAEEIYVYFYRDLTCLKQDNKIFFHTPKTWWDHFKMKHRGNWLIKRLKPFQFVEHNYDVEKMLVFPDFKIPRGQEFKNYFIITQARLKT